MKCLLSFLVALLQCGFVHASMPDTSLPILNHRAYSPIDGAPSYVMSLAQATDGTLWLGTDAGLVRFDGVRFVEYPGQAEDPLPTDNISSLLATPDGGLWIGYLRGGATFLKDGHTANYGRSQGLPGGTLLQFALDSNGTLWAASTTGLARLMGTHWEEDVDSARFQQKVRGLLVDKQGNHWVASAEGVYVRTPGETSFREIVRSRFALGKRSVLAEAPNGEIWATSAQNVFRVKGAWGQAADIVAVVPGSADQDVGPIIFDRQGISWLTSKRGLLRMPAGASDMYSARPVPPAPMSHPHVASILQDREGNVWVGTRNGLDRFSPGSVLRHPVNCSPATFAAGEAGALWIACLGEGAVTERLGDQLLQRLDTPPITASHRDGEGTVWFATTRKLGHVSQGRIVWQPLPKEVFDLPVQALVREVDGAIWLSSFRGLFRLQADRWVRNGKLGELPPQGAMGASRASDGALWFGYSDGRVARVKDGRVRLFGKPDGLAVGWVFAFDMRGDEGWVAGDKGLAHFDGARFTVISSPDTPLRNISGVMRASDGDLWINSSDGVARITRADIDAAMRDPRNRARVEVFNYLDGLPGTTFSLRPVPSIVESSDGRMWFATKAGIVSIDPRNLVRNPLAPPVTIWAVKSDAQRWRNNGQPIRLPVDTNRLLIEYSAGSLTVPERVRFRYRLEGLDRDWQDAGNRREAVYTNLGPGDYRFHVIASNNDGIWNETGASLPFSIAPAYYQTRWFLVACGLAALLILFALYKLRVRQVSTHVLGRMEARLAERERIARELHDTLLQSFQGLLLRLQTAFHVVPDGEGRRILAEGIDQAADAITEGRNSVQGLRASGAESELLEEAIRALGQTLAVDPSSAAARFSIEVEGRARALHPIVRDEVFRIVAEALRNAYRHADPTLVVVHMHYGARAFQVRIRDDGRGMDQTVIRRGRDGHFGMTGMRERAKLIAGKLAIWSRAGSGTEIELALPASRAYSDSENSGRAS